MSKLIENNCLYLLVEQMQHRWEPKFHVNNQPHRVWSGPKATGKMWIVTMSCFCTDENGRFLGSPFMNKTIAQFITDKHTRIIRIGNFTISCSRPFQNDIRTMVEIVNKKPCIQIFAFLFQNAGLYFHLSFL